MGKLNIILDGNYHMHRSLYAYDNVSEIKLETEEDQARFVRKLATDICYVIRNIGVADRVIWTIDNNSWRKSIDIDQNNGYKKNRVYADTINWKNFANINREFGQILESHNCICSDISGFEGDDWLYFWSQKLYNDGEDVILVSGDKDITQLVKCNGKNFVVVFNDNSTAKKLFVPQGFQEYLNEEDEMDIFNLDTFTNNKEVMKEMMSNVNVEITDSNLVLLSKIVSGDDGDNVPPIITWQETQKSGKVINKKITEKKAELIKEAIDEKYNECDVTNLSKYSDVFVSKIKEFFKQDIDEDTVKSRLDRNTKLVYLNEAVIPSNLKDNFEEHVKTVCSGYPSIKTWRMQDLLLNTKYYEENAMGAIESDIFKSSKPKSKAKSDKSKNQSVDALYKSLF